MSFYSTVCPTPVVYVLLQYRKSYCSTVSYSSTVCPTPVPRVLLQSRVSYVVPFVLIQHSVLLQYPMS